MIAAATSCLTCTRGCPARPLFLFSASVCCCPSPHFPAGFLARFEGAIRFPAGFVPRALP